MMGNSLLSSRFSRERIPLDPPPHKALAYISKGPHHHRIEGSLLIFFKFVPLFADFIIGITFVDVNGHTSSLMVYFICWKQVKMCIVLQKLLSFLNFQITSYCSHFSFIRTVAVKYDITRWNLNYACMHYGLMYFKVLQAVYIVYNYIMYNFYRLIVQLA